MLHVDLLRVVVLVSVVNGILSLPALPAGVVGPARRLDRGHPDVGRSSSAHLPMSHAGRVPPHAVAWDTGDP